MLRILRTGLFLGVLTVLLATAGCTAGGTGGGDLPAPGRSAPDFELVTLDGNTVSLSEFRGSPVVLNFWASWCGACREEMPFLQAVHDSDAWRQQGIKIVGVNIQEPLSVVEQFMAEYGLTFPVLLDSRGDAARRYNISGIPTTFFIDEGGIIRSVKIGAFSSVTALERELADLVAGNSD